MLRIATFNVLFGHWMAGPGSWPERRPLMRRVLQAARPDVLGLQEVLPSTLEDVVDLVAPLTLVPGPCSGRPRWSDASLPFEAVMRMVRTLRLSRTLEGHGRSERMTAGEHQPIAYRSDRYRLLESSGFWISSNPDHPGSMLPLALTPFLVHWARLEALDGSGPLLVMNAHFGHAPWHHAATARIVAAQMRALDDASDRAVDVVGALPSPSSVFLVGDFNARPSSGLVDRLTSPAGPGLVDAAGMAAHREGPPVTYHWGMGTTRLGLTLDYVLARTALHPRRAEVVDVHEARVYPSDHHLLMVEFGPLATTPA